jgi:hypothetical protein
MPSRFQREDYQPRRGDASAAAGAIKVSWDSRSTDSGSMTSKPWPHRGQTICWIPQERVAVLRTGNESPYGHSIKVMSPAAIGNLPGARNQCPAWTCCSCPARYVTITGRTLSDKLLWLCSFCRRAAAKGFWRLLRASYLSMLVEGDPAAVVAGERTPVFSRTSMGRRGKENVPPASSITLT